MHAAIATGLRELGTEVLFGLTGSGNLFIADSFLECGDGRFVRAAHEAGAVQMAQGYAKVSNRLGVVTVSMGPGLTNSLTGLVEGTRGWTRVLVVATEAAVEEKFHWQGIGQEAQLTATGAGIDRQRPARTPLRDLARAAQRDATDRPHVVLNCAHNMQHPTVSA
jgi:acetolactate synthase I/II/III large subunit